MRLTLKRVTIALAVSALAAAGMSAPRRAKANPAVGTWKLNLAKSSFAAGSAPQSQKRTYEDWGCDIEHVVQEGVDSNGKATFVEFAARFDGRDYPRVNRGSATAGTIALTKVNSKGTIKFVQKEDRKISISGTRTLSADQKTLTVTYTGSDAATMVFDRQ